MEFLKILLLIVAFIGFGFYSFQKGRAYERGEIRELNHRKKK